MESIEVFTTGDNVNLSAVFKAMQEKAASFPLVDAKADNNTIKGYFKSVFPEFDEDRVYVSDMKKMVKWFSILEKNDLLKFDEAAEETAEVAEAPAAEAAPAEEAKPKKKAPAKKAAAETEGAEGEEKPAPKKKAAPKKAAADAEGAEGEEKKPKTTRKKKTEE
ncbi:DUF5606 domain-containing protein [Chitinophaga sp. NPDC101104]|uniref:DUF6852 domain-containing protein n=1 Tax=Chitinophaga sp. NPDC101104 TaxID=3390561 RepID=UPI003D033C82